PLRGNDLQRVADPFGSRTRFRSGFFWRRLFLGSSSSAIPRFGDRHSTFHPRLPVTGNGAIEGERVTGGDIFRDGVLSGFAARHRSDEDTSPIINGEVMFQHAGVVHGDRAAGSDLEFGRLESHLKALDLD